MFDALSDAPASDAIGDASDHVRGSVSEPQVKRTFSPQSARAAALEGDPELTLREVARVLRENWKLLTVLAVLGSLIAATVVLLTPRTYTATASFVPESGGGGGGLSSLAQQYGLNLPGSGGEGGPSLPFYVELLRSREILGQALVDTVTYQTPEGVVTEPLITFLDLEAETPAGRFEDGVRVLRSIIQPLSNPNTGIVRFDVTTTSPEVSSAIAARLLDLVHEFNLQKRQSHGASERQFAEQRLAEMTDSLRGAERRLEEFEAGNPQYAMSPYLRMTHRRLMNDLAAKQALHTAIAQAYEQARMDEVRDTPLITPLERPTEPVRPDSRGGVPKVMFGAIFGLLLGTPVAFFRSSRGATMPGR